MQLVRFLMKLASEYVQIELKNGTVVAGTVLSVAPNMNTVLKDVKMTVKGEDPTTMDSITLRGNSIRYYILPDAISLDNMIVDESRRPRTARPPPPKRGRGDFNRRGGSISTRGQGNNNIRGSGRGDRGRGAMRGSPRGRAVYRGSRGSGRGSFRGASRGKGPNWSRPESD